MRGHSILLAFAGTLPSPTTADPIVLAIVVPTESASLPLDGLKNSGLLDQQRPGVPTPRQVVSEGTGKETCGFFRTGGGPADPICSGKTQNGERTLCCNTESPACGTLLRGSGESQRTGLACFGADFKTKSIKSLAANTWPTIIVVVVGFGYFLQAPNRVCETLRYPDGHDTPGIFDE
ncbi:hypothetical protein CFIO01_10284 [Colletotrichum fioriniae PJ7]|uniref:Uncharacterized protein n=1 Tax=Colletotrichum fioriniae PJ7 TaxID=1445577 RepID=A0A010RI86_9PEZI|nr:hypothetical protein CFIO01_10284 [Colletotrichum fioriniae PJ7]